MKFAKKLRRTCVFLCGLLMLLSTICFIPSPMKAKQYSNEKVYDIAVVFDNSGSMYRNTQRWCRAKYAMEIFASMLNYDRGDRLYIFPMWKVTTDGTSKSGGSYQPIEISNKNDIDKISNLYTPKPGNTPFTPADEAVEFLTKNNRGSEEWIVVLSDGEFNLEVRKEDADDTFSEEKLKNKLLDCTKDDIHVQYLGFGEATKLESIPSKNFYALHSKEDSLKEDLVSVCNQIFERDELKGKLKGKKLTLDLSMKNLIVFAQGNGAKITGLKDENNESINIIMDSGQRKYSKISAGEEYTAVARVDDTLYGQVVTFDSCKKGTYTLEYENADKIQIFYNPDVDLKYSLKNGDGKDVDFSKGEISSGQYEFNCDIVDAKTNEIVTDNELLGDNVDIKATMTYANGEQISINNGDMIEFRPDDKANFHMIATYLDDYRIEKNENGNGKGLKIKDTWESRFKITAEPLQKNGYYWTVRKNDWEPIKVSMTLNGKPLSEEEMKNTKLDFSFSKDIPYYAQRVKGESAYYVYIGKDKDQNNVDVDCGNYEFKATASVVNENDETLSKSAKCEFEVKWYPSWWYWIVLIALAILLFVLWYLYQNQDALPKKCKITYREGGRNVEYVFELKEDYSINITGQRNAIRIQVAKNCKRKDLKKRPSFKIVAIEPGRKVESFIINGTHYRRANDGSYLSGKSPFKDATIRNNSTLDYSYVTVQNAVRTSVVPKGKFTIIK